MCHHYPRHFITKKVAGVVFLSRAKWTPSPSRADRSDFEATVGRVTASQPEDQICRLLALLPRAKRNSTDSVSCASDRSGDARAHRCFNKPPEASKSAEAQTKSRNHAVAADVCSWSTIRMDSRMRPTSGISNSSSFRSFRNAATSSDSIVIDKING